MKWPVTVTWVAIVMLLGGGVAAGQSHTLYGDFKITNDELDIQLPQVFRVVLKNLSGQHLRWETVSPNGRYRFHEVTNGDYLIGIEADGREMVEMRIRIDEMRSTDIRRDLELQWSGLQEARPPPRTRYARGRSQQEAFERAATDLAEGNLEQAAELLRRIVEKNPGDFEAWTELGTVHHRNGEFERARDCYRTATGLKRDYLLAWLNLGKAEVMLESYPSAVEALTRVVQADPQRAEAFYYLGEAALQLKQGAAAIRHFERALELAPVEMADAHLRMANLYWAAGYVDRAIREYEAFLRKVPDYPKHRQIEEFIARNRKP